MNQLKGARLKMLMLSALFFTAFRGRAVNLDVTASDGQKARLTVALCQALESPTIQSRRREGKYLTTAFLAQVVDWAWEAANYTPSFGHNHAEITARLVSSSFGESGLNTRAVNLNKNRTEDIGLMQVNSCHWSNNPNPPTWDEFCKCFGLQPDISQLWNGRINMLFAAFINERRLKEGKTGYKFANPKRQDQKYLYAQLLKACQ